MKKIITLLLLTTNISLSQQICRTELEVPSTTPNSQFYDNSNGTISDLTTGLMWQKCQIGLSGSSCDIGSISGLNWQDALFEASNNTLGGYSDWRVPNVSELESIIEMRCYNPAINSNFFPNTSDGMFWTSTPVSINSGNTWGIYFDDGYISGYGIGQRRYQVAEVRLVRSGP